MTRTPEGTPDYTGTARKFFPRRWVLRCAKARIAHQYNGTCVCVRVYFRVFVCARVWMLLYAYMHVFACTYGFMYFGEIV